MLFLIKKEFDFDLNDIYFLIQQIFVTNQNFTIQNKKKLFKALCFSNFFTDFCTNSKSYFKILYFQVFSE